MEILKPKRLFEIIQAAGRTEYNVLLKQMRDSPELKQTLNTPSANHPKYQYLSDDPLGKYLTPLQIIQGTMKLPGFAPYFVKNSKGLYVGFLAVNLGEEDDKTVVKDIKVFSFGLDNQDDENQMFKDLPRFLDQCLAKYHKVSWGALEGNKANRAYAIYTRRHKGTIVKNGNQIRYTCNENFQRHTLTEFEMRDICNSFPL